MVYDNDDNDELMDVDQLFWSDHGDNADTTREVPIEDDDDEWDCDEDENNNNESKDRLDSDQEAYLACCPFHTILHFFKLGQSDIAFQKYNNICGLFGRADEPHES
jgi:hypothetical protein